MVVDIVVGGVGIVAVVVTVVVDAIRTRGGCPEACT